MYTFTNNPEELNFNKVLIKFTDDLNTQNYAIGNVFIGARNNISSNSDPFATSTPGNFSKTEIRLTTIGDGLTDYEAKALYWIVQKFQTTLGRQVY